jgi:hypothetical protein
MISSSSPPSIISALTPEQIEENVRVWQQGLNAKVSEGDDAGMAGGGGDGDGGGDDDMLMMRIIT